MTSAGDSSRKWLVPDPPNRLAPAARADYWEDVHRTADYDNVYSLTDDAALRRRLIHDLTAAGARDILVPGCGSRVRLQEAVAAELPDARLTCVDFPGVVEIAESRFSGPGVRYVGGDVATMEFAPEFDAVVHVTSVVSESDAENRDIMARTVAALRPGGTLLGVFPTVFATLDIAYTTGEEWRAQQLDLATSTYSEPKQGVSQIFYAPLRLRRIAKESGLTDLSMSLFFNDSEYLRSEGARHYELFDEDAVLYHLYLRGTRAA
jgi:hypothetical protein